MTRNTAAGDELVSRGVLHQLVGAFIEMPPEQQRGVAIRVAGPDWTREFVDEEIRELAARPEFTGATGQWDSSTDPDEPDHGEEAQGEIVESGMSGSSRL